MRRAVDEEGDVGDEGDVDEEPLGNSESYRQS